MKEHLEEIGILVGMYRDLERRYGDARLSTAYLEATTGVELFNTDRLSEPPSVTIGPDSSVMVCWRTLEPDVPYVLSSLAKAEEALIRHLSSKPDERIERIEQLKLQIMHRRVVRAFEEYLFHRIIHEGYTAH